MSSTHSAHDLRSDIEAQHGLPRMLGDDNIEKTDLKKGDYIEIDLNSSFQYGRQVGWRTGWAL